MPHPCLHSSVVTLQLAPYLSCLSSDSGSREDQPSSQQPSCSGYRWNGFYWRAPGKCLSLKSVSVLPQRELLLWHVHHLHTGAPCTCPTSINLSLFMMFSFWCYASPAAESLPLKRQWEVVTRAEKKLIKTLSDNVIINPHLHMACLKLKSTFGFLSL